MISVKQRVLGRLKPQGGSQPGFVIKEAENLNSLLLLYTDFELVDRPTDRTLPNIQSLASPPATADGFSSEVYIPILIIGS
ncbi:MAG: hypothetical protein WBA89_08125 [Microcoleus sp.]|uniref:hypothetical protein n=1 Tax=Microcoleus sp. TaxID=44472 RepID=UPI003C77A96A